jgi:hypothetical protein
MPSTHIHSGGSPEAARGFHKTGETPGISDPLAVLAAQQAAAIDALLASPEYARQQAGQQLLIAELIRQADAAVDLLYPDHNLAMPRRRDADGTRGDHRDQR